MSEKKSDARPFVMMQQILAAYAEFGRVDYEWTKAAMGPNWPKVWDRLGPGQGIFEPLRKPSDNPDLARQVVGPVTTSKDVARRSQRSAGNE